MIDRAAASPRSTALAAAAIALLVLACAFAKLASSPQAARGANDAQQPASSSSALTDEYPPPAVTAKAWIVYDESSGTVVAGTDIDTPRPIASLTKLMTALLAIEHIQPETNVTIPTDVNDLPSDAAMLGAHAGQRWPMRDLLQATLVYSANDAATALAAHVGDGDVSKFVDLMNRRADELHLTGTTFTNPTGLDVTADVNKSTPLDLAVLSAAARHEPLIRDAVRLPSVTLTPPSGGTAITLATRNPLLGNTPGVDGMKTGHTDAAGFTYVAHVLDSKSNASFVVVTLGSTSEATRKSDARALIDWARPLWSTVTLVQGGQALGSVPVAGVTHAAPLFACDDLRATTRVGDRIQARVRVPAQLTPPFRAGDEVGRLTLQIGTRDANAPGSGVEGGGDGPSTAVCVGSSAARRTRMEKITATASDVRRAWRLGVDEVRYEAKRVRQVAG